MITYNAAICAWDKVKQPGLAMVLLLGLEPNVVTYNTASSACVTANQPDMFFVSLGPTFLAWSRHDHLHCSHK